MLIAMCGVDGSGKTTQLNLLRDYLSENYSVFCTKQPTDWYRKDQRLRAFLHGNLEETPMLVRELALYAAADRLRHIQTEIQPRIEAGQIIITDRYVYSTYAYFQARGIDMPWLISINQHAIQPDVTIYIDIPAEVAMERVAQRDGDKAKKEEKDFNRLNQVRNTFLERPWGDHSSYYVVDGTANIENVSNEIRRIIDTHLIKI